MERDRLIRFCHVDVPGKPEVLSHYDALKNLILIDRMRVMALPQYAADQLLFTQIEFTKVNSDCSGFEPYSA